jgi:hypothetical protein
MACRGIFLAITPDQAEALLAASDDHALIEAVQDIEMAWDEDNLAQCDKAWDAMHRVLTDGSLGDPHAGGRGLWEYKPRDRSGQGRFGNGPEPLRHCVLGPNQLHHGDEYIVSLVSPDKVKEVSAALMSISKEWFDDRYRTLVPHDYAPEYGDVDREYTWGWFQSVRELYGKAAERGRFVLFTVDQ